MIKKHTLLIALLVSFASNVNITVHAMQKSQETSKPVYHDAIKACETGDLQAISQLSDKIDPNYGDKFNYTPLHAAAFGGHLDIVKYLVEKRKAKVDIIDANKKTPLIYAVENNDKKTIEYLVKNGANINIETKFNTLLEDSNYVGTPLGYAVFRENQTLTKLLVKLGADTEIKNKEKTPLWYIITSTQYKALHYTPNGAPQENWKRLEMIKLLLNHKIIESRYDGETPLCYATRTNNFDLLQLLIKYKANVNAKDKDGHMPLHNAILNKNYNIIELLLKEGADKKTLFDSHIGARGYRETPLNHAARTNNLHLLKLLFKYGGANMLSRDYNKATSLHLAALNGHIEIATLLLEEINNIIIKKYKKTHLINQYKKYCINLLDNRRLTPLWLAILSQEYIEEDKSLEMIALLLNNKANTENQMHGQTPLHYAAKTNNPLLFELLITYEANINTGDKYGHTPLHYAIINENYIMAETLLINGAKPYALAKKTILYLAVEQNNLEIVKLLVRHGAPITSKYNYNPLDQAVFMGSTEIVAYLLKHNLKLTWNDIKNNSNNIRTLLEDIYYFKTTTTEAQIKALIDIAKDHDITITTSSILFQNRKRIIRGISHNNQFNLYLATVINSIMDDMISNSIRKNIKMTKETIEQIALLYNFLKMGNIPEDHIKNTFQDMMHINQEVSLEGFINFLEYLLRILNGAYEGDTFFKNMDDAYITFNNILRNTHQAKKYGVTYAPEDLQAKIDLLTKEEFQENFLQEAPVQVNNETKTKIIKDIRLQLIIGNKKDKDEYKKRIFIPHACIADSKKLKKLYAKSPDDSNFCVIM